MEAPSLFGVVKRGVDRIRKTVLPRAPRPPEILYGYRILNIFITQQASRSSHFPSGATATEAAA